jgi:hypothetical protein
MTRQPHTEETVEHTEGQQSTGNHKKPGAPDAHGADRFGGTRTGAENVESPASHPNPAQKGSAAQRGKS